MTNLFDVDEVILQIDKKLFKNGEKFKNAMEIINSRPRTAPFDAAAFDRLCTEIEDLKNIKTYASKIKNQGQPNIVIDLPTYNKIYT